MQHLAIMNPKLKMVDKILTGQKTIESRWYKKRISPWGKIKTGDKIYFKETGLPVTASAIAGKVSEIQLKDQRHIKELISRHHTQIGLTVNELLTTSKEKRYLILIELTEVQKLKTTFQIDKRGFGMQSSWLILPDINQIKKLA